MRWGRFCNFGFGIGGRRTYYFSRYGADRKTDRGFLKIIGPGDSFDDSR